MIYYLLEDVSQSETTENRGKTEETCIILYSNPQKDRHGVYQYFCTILPFYPAAGCYIHRYRYLDFYRIIGYRFIFF